MDLHGIHMYVSTGVSSRRLYRMELVSYFTVVT